MNFIKNYINNLYILSFNNHFLNNWFRNFSLNFTFPFLKSLLGIFGLRIYLRNSILTNEFKAFGSDIDFSIVGEKQKVKLWKSIYKILSIFILRLREWEYYTPNEFNILQKIKNSKYQQLISFIASIRKLSVINSSNSSTFKKDKSIERVKKKSQDFQIPFDLFISENINKFSLSTRSHSDYLDLSYEFIRNNFKFKDDIHLNSFLSVLPDELIAPLESDLLKIKLVNILYEFILVQNKIKIEGEKIELKKWSNKLFLFLYINRDVELEFCNLLNFLHDYMAENFHFLSSMDSIFCMAPWAHFHIMPSSNVIPCCDWPYENSFGNVSENKLKDLWNNEKYSYLRQKMIYNVPTSDCNKCYQKDKLDHHSLRRLMNTYNSHQIKDSIDTTNSNGELHNFKMTYFDVRFSNICNFKCRGCSPELSSSWLSDYELLHDNKTNKNPYINIFPNEHLLQQLIDLVPTIEHAYFAGGEPLVMKEHYDFLDQFINLNRTDIKLAYNTNLSTLRFKDKNIIEYWSKFSEVSLGISIDDLEERNEYFRKGTKWNELISNIEWIKTNCPHIYIYINCTISNITVLNLHKFFEYFISKNIVTPDRINFNLVFNPDIYSIQTLPIALKRIVNNNFTSYLETCKSEHSTYYETIRSLFTNVNNHMMKEDKSNLFKQFLNETKKLDEIRNEKLTDHFKEFLPYY